MAKFYYVADIPFELLDDPIVLGDRQDSKKVPWDCEILGASTGPKIDGVIHNAGTGAGTATQIQFRNETTGRDYLTTVAEYRVDSKDVNNRAPLEGPILCTRPTAKAGERIALDVVGIPGGADSAKLYATLTCGFWREVP